MDLEITLPQAPVKLVPGTESSVRVEVANRSDAPLSVRLGVSRSRGGAWGEVDTPVLDLGPDERREVQVVFKPPANVLPTSTLMPFTVHAQELPYGVPAGRATGLLTVAAPERVDATIAVTRARRRTTRFAISLTNRGDASLTVGLAARVQPPGAKVVVTPKVVDVPGDGSATATVRVRPRRAVIGTATPFALSVACTDAAAPHEMPPLATISAAGTAKPRMRRGPARVLGIALLLVATAATLVLTGTVDMLTGERWQPLRRNAAATSPSTAQPGVAQPGAAQPGTDVSRPDTVVRRPYALVEVFAKDGAAGRAAAEAARARLAAAGMPVRLVDSTATDQVADGPTGLWVLLQDGMPTVDAVRAYCDRYRPVAPKCEVVP
jgi:hypothetical protein